MKSVDSKSSVKFSPEYEYWDQDVDGEILVNSPVYTGFLRKKDILKCYLETISEKLSLVTFEEEKKARLRALYRTYLRASKGASSPITPIDVSIDKNMVDVDDDGVPYVSDDI